MSALSSAISIFGWALLLFAALGTLYMALATRVLARFFRQNTLALPRTEPVTLLKPLYGAEPRLLDNLASFLDQDHAGPVQLLLGVHRDDDDALPAVRALQSRYSQARIDLVIDGTRHGANGKVANLINMMPHAAHDILILSDSDMWVERDYVMRIVTALETPGVGAVSCVYRGRGDAGFWSRLGAAGLSWQFLPGAVFGTALKLARPCMGSTIALHRATLDRIGGFPAFADKLADDFAIGEAVHALGLAVAIPPMLVVHGSAERSFGELWRHELRWGATVRDVVPVAYAMGVIGIPLPLALLGLLIHPTAGAIIALAALIIRLTLAATSHRIAGAQTAPLWWLPMRDCLTLGVFIASLFVRRVDWRGTALNMGADGRVTALSETAPS
jgi:ceramide glucosyltransferase